MRSFADCYPIRPCHLRSVNAGRIAGDGGWKNEDGNKANGYSREKREYPLTELDYHSKGYRCMKKEMKNNFHMMLITIHFGLFVS